jgi:hypothetical protein
MTILQLLKYLGYAETLITKIGLIPGFVDRPVTNEDMLEITARMDATDAKFAELLKRKAMETPAA